MSLRFSRLVLRPRGRQRNTLILYADINTRIYLIQQSVIDALEATLFSYAPHWCARVSCDNSSRAEGALSYRAQNGRLFELLSEARDRSLAQISASRAREAALSDAPRSRVDAVSLELRGAHDALIVIVSASDRQFHLTPDAWIWSNRLSLQILADDIEGTPGPECARKSICELTPALGTEYARAYTWKEFETKNISRRGGGYRALGGNVANALPGLYWLNFFGRSYVELIGLDRLMTAPAPEVREIGGGVLMLLDDDPRAWDTRRYRRTERCVLKHLGPRFFFSKWRPWRRTVAPDFELPPIPPPKQWRTAGPIRVGAESFAVLRLPPEDFDPGPRAFGA